MKEIMTRDFIVELKEFTQKLGLPEGNVANVEVAPDAIHITMVNELK